MNKLTVRKRKILYYCVKFKYYILEKTGGALPHTTKQKNN